MTGIQKTLLAIFTFVAICVGTFVYFIANWDAAKAEPVSHLSTQVQPFFSSQILRGLGQSPSPTLDVRTTA